MQTAGVVHHTSGAAHGTLHCLFVCVFLSFHVQFLVEQDGAEPIVAIVSGVRGFVHLDAVSPSKSLPIKFLDMSVVVQMLLKYRHLAAAYTGADVAHAVVVTDGFMLVIGVGFPCLCGIPHDAFPALVVGAHNGSAA